VLLFYVSGCFFNVCGLIVIVDVFWFLLFVCVLGWYYLGFCTDFEGCVSLRVLVVVFLLFFVFVLFCIFIGLLPIGVLRFLFCGMSAFVNLFCLFFLRFWCF